MVSQRRLKRPVSALVALVFLSSLLVTLVFEVYTTVSASTPIKPVILEVTDVPKSGEQLNVGANFDVQKMSMKQFNALRYDLLGRYDAIVFSPSGAENGKKYNPEQVKYNYQQDKNIAATPYAENTNQYKEYIESLYLTKDKDNDISKLRVRNLISLSKAGVPIWLHNDVFSPLTNKNVVRNFEQLKNTDGIQVLPQINVISNGVKDYFAKKSLLKLNEVTVKQGEKTLTNQVSINQSNNFAVRGKAIDFSYALNEIPSSNAKVELYIDFDSNDRFSLEERVVSTSAEQNGKLSYTIDSPSYTSPRYWKIIVKDEINQTYHYRTGRFLLKDEIAKAKILQVKAVSSDASSLYKTFDGSSNTLNETNQQMLNETDLYNFDLEVVSLQEFENRMKKVFKESNQYDSREESWFFEKDLIIFGFQDSFGRLDFSGNQQNFSTNAASIPNTTKALREFVNRGQGVMFSHDMLYRLPGAGGYKADATSQREWETAFGKDFAIKNLINLGKRGVYTTRQVEQVSKGLFTEYPYQLPEQPTNNMISETHSQYFSLDMDNEDLTVWYNLTSGKHEKGDSAHHYYMYTVNNLTYSGAGHKTTFPDLPEKQIFVNTMFRAFIGSNHAPKIEVLAPQKVGERREIYDVEPLYLSWNSIDYDFKDRTLLSRVVIDGKQVFPTSNTSQPTFQSVKNGEIQNLFYKHSVKGNGTIKVEIETKDTGGAITKENFDVFVKPSTDAAFVSRTINPNSVEVDGTAKLQYDVSTRLPELSRPNENSYKEKQWEINVTETIPTGYTLSEIQPRGWVINRQTNEVSAKLRKLGDGAIEIYDVAAATWSPFADSNTLTLKAKTIGEYVFESGKYTYKFTGDHASNNNANGKDIVQEGSGTLTPLRTSITEKAIQSIQLRGPINLEIGDSVQLIPTIQPSTDQKLNLRWTADDSSIASVNSSYTDNSGIVTGLKPGTTKLRVSYTKGNRTIVSNEIEVNVIDPVKNFTVNQLDLIVGEQGKLSPNVDSKTALYQNFVFEVVEGQSLVETKLTDSKQLTLIGKQPGIAKVKVSLLNQPVGKLINPIYTTVTVKLPDITMTPASKELWVYQTSREVDGKVITDMVRQQVTLQLGQQTSSPLPIAWSIPDNESVLRFVGGQTIESATVQAIQGTYPNLGPVAVQAALRDFQNQMVNTQITIKEYPQSVLTPNVELYMEESPFVYAPQFYPTTSTVRGYGMRVVEGQDIVEVMDYTKLKLKKPGVAKVQIATEDVSQYFSAGEGPKVVFSEFYVRVREGTRSNPESPDTVGDYY